MNEETQFIKPARQDCGQIAYTSYVSDLSKRMSSGFYFRANISKLSLVITS